MVPTPATVTIKDVARRAGVSAMTVSRVINGSARVHPETKRRVEDSIAALGYVPSRLARGLIRQKTGTLALIVPDVANPFFTLIVRGAEDVARRAGYRMILCDTRADLAIEREVIEEMIAHRVEGIAIAPVSDRSRPHLERLRNFGIDFVLVDRTVSGVEQDVVHGDNSAGARRLVRHLLDLGHRRVGFIVESDDVSTARDRHQGYRDALQEAGLDLDPALIARAPAVPEGGLHAMRRLLEVDDPPTAVFAVNNLVALGAIEAVRAQGLEVPDDVALVCFDDIEHASRLYPFLTVMAQPAETLGTIGTQLLLDRIEGRASDQARVVVLPAQFLVRRSCGGAAA
ncbi:MAG TPA: LacI family DNA-binding transcriptional regulator [Gaiellaceae bacterium]|jgi:LacI family transcriptional regulator|nr:LacI family DNA-binding transcriptional regulator [Gaiellaceae bacterium]